MHSADAFAPVAYLHFLKLHLENKASRLQVLFSFKAICMLSSCVVLSQFGVNLHILMWVLHSNNSVHIQLNFRTYP